MMKYRYFLPVLFIITNISLYAKENSLSDILKKAGEKKILIKPTPENKKPFHFTFISKEPPSIKNESQSYQYKNKSKFKFKFSSGSGNNNIIGSKGAGSAGGRGGSRSGGGRR